MNLALVLEQTFDPDAGGVQRSTSKLARIFKDNGHKVVIISTSKKISKIESWYEIPIFQINIKTDRSLLNQIIENEKLSLIINQAGSKVPLTKFLINNNHHKVRIVNTLRINPLNFHDNYKEFIGLFFSQRKLSFLNNSVTQKLLLRYHIIKQRFDLNYMIKNLDAFVMLSERFRPELYFLAPSLKKYNQKIHGISNPFERPEINLNEIEKENIILFVGRIENLQKRVDLLMEIWKALHHELPDWEFWVVGDGDDKSFMEKYCKDNKLGRVQFFGQDNPNEYYKKAKIFHMTSAFEGFGNVLVEAQSYGCVPVLFNSYSAAEDIVINNENGILITPFNISEFVEATVHLANNPEELKKLAVNSYQNVSRFSYQEIYKKWETVFKGLT
jgi:glycosyltransferase involved in cell wall biosynthesis